MNIKNLASTFLVAAMLTLPTIAHAQENIYLPLVSNSAQVGGTIPTTEPTDTPDTVTVGYTSVNIDVIPQTTLGRAIDYVDHAGLASQDNWTQVTGDFQDGMDVDQFNAHTYTTGTKNKPCIQIRIRKALTTISTQACYAAINADLYVQYHDAWVLTNALAVAIPN